MLPGLVCLEDEVDRVEPYGPDGLVQAAQRHLLAGAVGCIAPLGQFTAQQRQALALVSVGNRFARLAPGADALFQGCVVKLLV